jgi:hypothetical protein
LLSFTALLSFNALLSLNADVTIAFDCTTRRRAAGGFLQKITGTAPLIFPA